MQQDNAARAVVFRAQTGETLSQRLTKPHLPAGSPTALDEMTLQAIRDRMTHLAPHASTARSIETLFDAWQRDKGSVAPIQSIRELLDTIRRLPRGDERVSAMNTVVRMLGAAESMATLLDMVRDSANRHGTDERKLSEYSRFEPKHSLYGWCGQTKLISSSPDRAEGTQSAEAGVQEMLGKAPAEAWGLNMHIWQPNPFAKGFSSGKRAEPGILVEPPHSHPFDFASMVAIGSMHQSLYSEDRGPRATPNGTDGGERYSGVTLEHVHGVWPPHAERERMGLVTREDRVLMTAGDSYYLPCNAIHDVEIDAAVAAARPAITLFLRSEAVVKPHVYMASSMADFHEKNPDIEHTGKALSEEDWATKLELVSKYLRGEIPDLALSHVVKQYSDYAFLHR